jgi:endonuclease/exonuclease/phosphatase family metal-dependent hydrolase
MRAAQPVLTVGVDTLHLGAQVHKRNADSRGIIAGMQLGVETLGFELDLSCHHVVLMGDVNYRVTLSPSEAIQLMSTAS